MFKQIGLTKGDDDKSSGDKALNHAFQYLRTHNDGKKIVLLYDCDTNKPDAEENNVFHGCLTTRNSSANIRKGIENSLVIDEKFAERFYVDSGKKGDYGTPIVTFDKTKCCEYISNKVGKEELKIIFSIFKEEIDKLMGNFSSAGS